MLNKYIKAVCIIPICFLLVFILIKATREMGVNKSNDVIIKEKLPQRAYKLGNWFMKELKKIKSPIVKDVRGKGLLIGVELTKKARKYCESLMKLGILAKETHNTVIRFAPPLVIKKKELEWTLPRIGKVLKK